MASISIHSTFVAAVPHFIPHFFPFFPPGERAVANRTVFGGKVGFTVHGWNMVIYQNTTSNTFV
jgi:hypothetical protein